MFGMTTAFIVCREGATLVTENKYGRGSKMRIFQMIFLLCKTTATLLPTCYVLTINETFQMRY